MDFTLTEFEGELLDLGRTYAEREIAPVAARAWHEERCPTELLRGLGELGLLGPLVPEKWGGIGSSTVGYVALLEALGSVDPSVASAWQAHSTIGSLPLLLFGNDEQRERWLRPLAEGRKLGAFGLTEPGAGSDAASIRMRAAAQPDGSFVLDGSKIWITNGGIADFFTVFAQTEVDRDGARKDRITAINQHFITAFLDLNLKGDESRRAYLHVRPEKSNDGKWPLAQGQSVGGKFSDGADDWKGFQRRWAVGMEMHCAAH